jgi:hypothetical protein
MKEGSGRMSTLNKAGKLPEAEEQIENSHKNAKKEYLENICNEIMEFQRTGRYYLMYMKTKELGWKETQGIQNIGIEDSQGNRIIEQSQVLIIWENCVYYGTTRST